MRLGNAIKKAGIVKESDICHEVKNILAEEIAAQNITVRTIDRYCLDEWKHITKPKKDKLSFSKQQIVVTQDGRSKTLQESIAPQQSDKGQQHTEENPASTQTADSKPTKQDIEKRATPVKQESAAAKAQSRPQESQVESKPEQVSQEPSHKVMLLLLWDSLSEQMGQVHSPGIKWVQLSGVLDEKSGIVSNLKLTNGRAEGGV
jgi:hypothetical protein